MTKKLAIFPFILIVFVTMVSLFMGHNPTSIAANDKINTGDTAWLLTSAALVLIMTPGLAFFYGGMVKKKNVISTMLQSFICMVIVSLIWVIFGFSLAFGNNMLGGFLGNPMTFFLMNGVLDGKPWVAAPTVPLVVFAFFQLKFAIISPALVTGAISERVRFTSYLLFICLFIIFIYCPLAHATWHPDGFLAKLGVLDFAGGTVVHLSAGVAALASAIYLKKRTDQEMKPARITYVLLGAGLLWFGWFGFNGGSAMGANNLAAIALATTAVASGAAAFAWIIFDALRGKKPSAMGTSIGAVVGLVAITPAAGFVSLPHAMVIGIVASFVSNLMVELRTRTGLDDTLDVFPCHGMGGLVGMILTGVFANPGINPVAGKGLFFGETKLFFTHFFASIAIMVCVFIMSMIILKITDLITPLRVNEEEEAVGLDITQLGESL
ncbi:MAG TPA: ammonium transporter [Niabella sp.]|nr:ammonium transporter [Chitinophagaceae bacterium]HRO83908.1 ammonium transporter [Niabella sp.]